jgi:hypothetical protein
VRDNVRRRVAAANVHGKAFDIFILAETELNTHLWESQGAS